MAKKLIELVGITKSFGDKTILDEMDLFMNENRFLTLLTKRLWKDHYFKDYRRI